MPKSIFLRLHLHPSPLWTIFEVNFFKNLAVATLSTVMAIYIRKFVNSDAAVGMVFFTGYAAATLSNYYSSRIIEHFKKRKATMLALIGFTMVMALFGVISRSATVVVIFAMYHFILALFIFNISLYLKHYSNYRSLAENTGKLGALGNMGWIVGPLLGGLIVNSYGFEAVFLFASGISLVALMIFFMVRLSGEEIHFHHTQSFAKNLKFFFKNPDLRKTYLNNAGLGFIYSIWDFLPLLMLKIGATLPIIGMTKALMGIPQAIFEYPIGTMADKETGERKIFIVGYLLAAVFTLLLGLTTNLKLFITFFFIAAVGTSFLEMTRDPYFFRQVPEKEIELIGVYRTSDTLPYLFGQALAIIVLLFLPVEGLFVIGGATALLWILNAYRLKEIKVRENF